MSQLSSGASFEALAGLAQKAGEGQAFLTKRDQEQQLIGNVLRQRQADEQSRQANEDREIRLAQLRAQNEQQRFSQNLAAQAEQRKAQRDAELGAIKEREATVANAMRAKQVERLESELGLRQQRLGLDERKFEAQQIQDTSPKAVNKQRGELIQNLARVEKLINEADLNDEQLIGVTQQRDQMVQQLVDIDGAVKEAAKNAIRTTQIQQTQRAVTRKEAGPKLTAALSAAGQSRVLEIPTDKETGRPDGKQLRVGRVYQTTQGPGVFLGPQAGFEVIDELEEAPQPQPTRGFQDRPGQFGQF